MDDFIRANVRSMRREKSPATPDVSHCLDVTRVAGVSIAAHAGVLPGDLLDSFNARPASRQPARPASNQVGAQRGELEDGGAVLGRLVC